MRRLAALMVLVEIRRDDGHRILQLAEPGIIGLNSAGIGVCLDILSGTASRPAVPVHVLLHTNHYVARPRDQSGDLLIPNSKRRYDRAGELLDADEPQSVERMQRILLDREGAPDSICAAYRDVGPFRIGTVSSIVMDLPRREMHLTAGNPAQHPYEAVAL